jgi:hypothetical protein
MERNVNENAKHDGKVDGSKYCSKHNHCIGGNQEK